MGLALCFENDEMKAIPAADGETCEVCGERTATWEATPTEGENPLKVCAHCAMYSMKAAWGYRCRAELLHVGRFCQGQALKHGREVPDLDERGRLEPEAAERYLMGVAYSTLVLKKMGRLGNAPESANSSN